MTNVWKNEQTNKLNSSSDLLSAKYVHAGSLRSSAAVGWFANHTIQSGGHRTACGQFSSQQIQSHIWSARVHFATNSVNLNLKIVTSFQGCWAWQRFISLMPQNLQDVKKVLVVFWGITNIQFKCPHYQKGTKRLLRSAFFKDVVLMVKLLPGTGSSLNVT